MFPNVNEIKLAVAKLLDGINRKRRAEARAVIAAQLVLRTYETENLCVDGVGSVAWQDSCEIALERAQVLLELSDAMEATRG